MPKQFSRNETGSRGKGGHSVHRTLELLSSERELVAGGRRASFVSDGIRVER